MLSLKFITHNLVDEELESEKITKIARADISPDPAEVDSDEESQDDKSDNWDSGELQVLLLQVLSIL